MKEPVKGARQQKMLFFPWLRVDIDPLEENIWAAEWRYDGEVDFDREAHQNHWKADCHMPSVRQQIVFFRFFSSTKNNTLCVQKSQ